MEHDPLTPGDQAWLDWHRRLVGEVEPCHPRRPAAPRRLTTAAIALIVASWLLFPLSAWLGLCSAVAGLLVTVAIWVRELR